MKQLAVKFSWLLAFAIAGSATFADDGAKKKLVIVAGRPSHGPGEHEFNAGVQLIAKCLANQPGLETKISLSGWPKDETLFDGASAVVFYMDGGGGHEVVQENGRRMKMVDEWASKGVGIGCMHYGVEVVADQAGKEFKRWIGGHYENMFSCNPMWEPAFAAYPDHPISRGVKPFQVKDEWYFNMRFVSDIPGNESVTAENLKFVPILVAVPSDDVRDGPYVHPKGPYKHIEANGARAEAMMWSVERPDGGRGFGFTGGHFHKNWGNEDFRKVVLNAMLWISKVDVPQGGVSSTVSDEELASNLDPKGKKK